MCVLQQKMTFIMNQSVQNPKILNLQRWEESANQSTIWLILSALVCTVCVCVCVCVCTSVSLKGGDQAAAVLLQLQDGHLTRLVPYEGVSGLHIKPRITLRSKKKKLCPAEKLFMPSSWIFICDWTINTDQKKPNLTAMSTQQLSCTVSEQNPFIGVWITTCKIWIKAIWIGSEVDDP